MSNKAIAAPVSAILNTRRAYSYQEAADLIGCDHHWVRMMTNRGRFEIVERVEIKPNVLKVFINADQVDQYIEDHRKRTTYRVKMTEEEYRQFVYQFGTKLIK